MKGRDYYFMVWENENWVDLKSPRTLKGQEKMARDYLHCLGIRYGSYPTGSTRPIDKTPPFYVIYNEA